eukprot:1530124-Amphidinium_carterae.1
MPIYCNHSVVNHSVANPCHQCQFTAITVSSLTVLLTPAICNHSVVNHSVANPCHQCQFIAITVLSLTVLLTPAINAMPTYCNHSVAMPCQFTAITVLSSHTPYRALLR